MIKKVVIIVLAGILLMFSGCSANIVGEEGAGENKAEDNRVGKNNDDDRDDGEDKSGDHKVGDNNDGDNKSGDQVIDPETPDQDTATTPSLGGISLGDSSESVANALGKDYTESTEPDVAEMIGEDMTIWCYESGIVVYLGKSSGRVLKITATSADFETDLGLKVGDYANTVSDAYKSRFEAAVRRHSDEVLEGWFLQGDGSVIIFDFDKSNDELVNSNVTPESKVEEIIFTHWHYFN